MSTLLHPTGSEPPQVYWKRRAVVIGAVVLVLLLIVWLAWPKGTGSSASAPPTAGPPSSALPSVPPASSPSASSSPAGSASASPTGPVACDPGSSQLDLAGYQKVKQRGKQAFKVAVKNTGAACVLGLNSTNLHLVVKSGTDQIWTTDDCGKWVPEVKKVNLKQGQSYQLPITWGLARSKPTCKTTKDVLKPGTYVATATFGTATTARQVFVITKAG